LGLALKWVSPEDAPGQHYPVLTCDTCGKPIEQLDTSLVTYQLYSGEEITEIKFCHKGKCDRKRLERGVDVGMGSNELKHYLPWLLWNHGWGEKQQNEDGASITISVPEGFGI